MVTLMVAKEKYHRICQTGFFKISPHTVGSFKDTMTQESLLKINDKRAKMWNLFSHFLCHPSKMGRHLISCINLSFLQDMDFPKWDLTPKGKHYSSWFPKLKFDFLEPFRTFLWDNVDSSLETKVLLNKRRLWKDKILWKIIEMIFKHFLKTAFLSKIRKILCEIKLVWGEIWPDFPKSDFNVAFTKNPFMLAASMLKIVLSI